MLTAMPYSTVKFSVVVNEPLAVVMVTGPVMAPAGMVALTDCPDVTKLFAAATPLKVTDVAPSKYLPHRITF